MNIRSLYWVLLVLGFLQHAVGQDVVFVENQGQWQSNFNYHLPLKYGGLFFEEDGIQIVLHDVHELEDHHGNMIHEMGMSASPKTLRHHALRLKFLEGKDAEPLGDLKNSFYHNYFIGSDSSRWRGNVPTYSALKYKGIYPESTLKFYQYGDQLKYDWLLGNPKEVHKIKWTYDGADSIFVGAEGTLIVQTSVGEFFEGAPVAFAYKNGMSTPVDISFQVKHKEVSFKCNLPDGLDSLHIDPAIVFASFSGSLTDNWGFTATFDDQERLYGGGVAFGTGYVATIGSYSTTYNAPAPSPGGGFIPDAVISVFEPTGSTLLYATYLGGKDSDHPQSMVVNSLGQLIVMGTTGSDDFPTANAIQNTNGGGPSENVNGYTFDSPDMFIARFNSTGTSLLSSTYLGGGNTDGINMELIENYGDASRGEVVVDENNNIYVTASTKSNNFPKPNCTSCNYKGNQDAFVMKLNPQGTAISWSNYFGTTGTDAGYSLKVHNGNVYLTGGTTGGSLPQTTGAFKSNKPGGTDGFIARFNASTGALIRSTYIGTSSYDQTFILDVDKLGNVYVFGQTLDNSYPISAGAWGTPQYRKQFLHKLNADLSLSMASTAFGSPQGVVNLVPTAFNVDDCLNILLSGWGGNTNNGYRSTTVDQLPVTTDAFQSTTDGSDFYFLVLGKNFQSFKYATYFGGGQSQEHVDGGTSRFDNKGHIYQAICAGCGGYSDLPTTPGAFSTTNNSNNCNLGVVKLDLETGIEADAEVDPTYLPDTSCYSLTLRLKNNSINANAFYWDFGQGDTSVFENPVVTFPNLGTYNVMLVAIDTICDISDTTFLEIVHDTANFPTTDWNLTYRDCDLLKEVQFKELLADATYYEWDFGDGTTKVTKQRNFSHFYNSAGPFVAVVTAKDSFCNISTQETFTISFDTDVQAPTVTVTTDSCRYGGVDVFYQNIDTNMIFLWDFSGTPDTGMIPEFRYPESGLESVFLTIVDTACNRDYSFNFTTEIVRIEGRVYIPNAFTPNLDNINPTLRISGNSCLSNPLFVIFDSWGNEVFRSERPFEEFWDGTFQGKPVPQDVYTYRFTGGSEVRMGTITVIR